MLVSFKFECMKHGEFDHYFNSVQYPDRNFPFYTVMCPIEGCNRLASLVITGANMSPDTYWSGKSIEALNLPDVSSRSYLRRYLKTNNIAQLTEDEIGHHAKRQKTRKEKIEEHINKPEVERERREVINDTLNKFGIT